MQRLNKKLALAVGTKKKKSKLQRALNAQGGCFYFFIQKKSDSFLLFNLGYSAHFEFKRDSFPFKITGTMHHDRPWKISI
jgi:hypothetical protein